MTQVILFGSPCYWLRRDSKPSRFGHPDPFIIFREDTVSLVKVSKVRLTFVLKFSLFSTSVYPKELLSNPDNDNNHSASYH